MYCNLFVTRCHISCPLELFQMHVPVWLLFLLMNSVLILRIFNRFEGLYPDVCLTKEEFEEMFDTKTYDKVRKDLNCEDAFPHAYDKISRVARGNA